MSYSKMSERAQREYEANVLLTMMVHPLHTEEFDAACLIKLARELRFIRPNPGHLHTWILSDLGMSVALIELGVQ